MIHDAQMDFYGTRLATCSSDRSIRIFEVKGQTQTPIADLREHEGPVSYIDILVKLYLLNHCVALDPLELN